MQISGYLRKMRVTLADPVDYTLVLGLDQQGGLNKHIGQSVSITFTGDIQCIHCQRTIKKTYNQGYCYPCFRDLAACDYCIIHPEKCHFVRGTCRQSDWGLRHCMQTHVVYLAHTSGLKIGVTRLTQIPTRWIDQGATQAVALYFTNSRYVAGCIEVMGKALLADKTNWRKMLCAQPDELDMVAQCQHIHQAMAPQLTAHFAESDHLPYVAATPDPIKIAYPMLQIPQRVQTLAVEGKTTHSGRLQGIKGQYWLFDHGVLNMRKYGGHHVIVGMEDDQ